MNAKYDFDNFTIELISKLIAGKQGNKTSISSRDVELDDEAEEKLPPILKMLKGTGLITSYDYFFPGAWEVTPSNELLTFFEEPKEEAVSAPDSDPLLEKVFMLISSIKKYDIVLESEFGPEAVLVREAVDNIVYMINADKGMDAIQPMLLKLQDLCISNNAGIIANGIYRMITMCM